MIKKLMYPLFAITSAAVLYAQPLSSTSPFIKTPDGCLIPFSAVTAGDSNPDADQALETIPAEWRDSDLGCNGPGSDATSRSPRTITAASSSPDGWTVVAGTVREFKSTDSQYMFSVAGVKDRAGRGGVLVSRGIYTSVQGAKVLNWERRVITNDQLVEYDGTVYTTRSFLTDIADTVSDIWSYFIDKLLPEIEKEFGKLASDAIKALFKEASKWLQKEIAKLFETGKSSQMPKLYLSQIQMNGAPVSVAERYVTSVISSRSTTLSVADRVFVSLSQPVEQLNEAKAGKALAKAIENIR